jgi:MFS transporter, DHA1 family, tetracycline resistance protein
MTGGAILAFQGFDALGWRGAWDNLHPHAWMDTKLSFGPIWHYLWPVKKAYLLPIFMIVAVDVLGLTIIIPFLPFYAQNFGATPFQVGSLITTFSLFQFISGPILGYYSDRFGRRPVLLLSQIGTFIGFIVLARASALWMIYLSRFLDGSTAGNISVAQAYISDVTEPKDRAKAFGIIGVAFGLGFLIGPAISGVLAKYGTEYPAYAAALLSASSIVLTYFILPEVPPHPDDAVEAGGIPERRLGFWQWGHYSRFFKDPHLANVLFQFMAFALGFSIFFAGFALFAERTYTRHGVPFGPTEVGYLFAYTGFIGLVLQGGFIGRLVNRFGEVKLIIAGFGLSAVGYALLGFTKDLTGLLMAATIASTGSSMLRPGLTSLVSRNTPRREQGSVLGVTQSMTSVAQIIGPLIAGALIQMGLLTGWALSAAFFSLIGFVMICRLRPPASA